MQQQHPIGSTVPRLVDLAERFVCVNFPPQCLFHPRLPIPATVQEKCAQHWVTHIVTHEGKHPAWIEDYLRRHPLHLCSRRALSVVHHAALMNYTADHVTIQELEQWFPKDCLLHYEFVRMTEGHNCIRICLNCLYEDYFWVFQTGIHITGYRRYKNPREALKIIQKEDSWCSSCKRVPLFNMHDLLADEDDINHPNMSYTFFERVMENRLPVQYTRVGMFNMPLLSPGDALPAFMDPALGEEQEVPMEEAQDADDNIMGMYEPILRDINIEEGTDVRNMLYYNDDDSGEEDIWDELIAAFIRDNGDIPERPRSPTPPPEEVWGEEN